MPLLHLVEAFDRAAGIVVDEGLVALVDVGGQELGGLGVGAGDDQRRRAHHVGGEPRGVEVADVGRGRDQHLAAEMAALLLRRQLVLVVDAGSARLDEGLHDLEGVERTAEAGFGIGDDRREPGVDRQAVAFRRLDLVGALQRAVDALGTVPAPHWPDRATGRDTWRRRGVGVGRDLPAGQVDRLQAGAHLLHRLVAGHGAERVDEIFLVDELPQPVGAHSRPASGGSGPSRAGASHRSAE